MSKMIYSIPLKTLCCFILVKKSPSIYIYITMFLIAKILFAQRSRKVLDQCRGGGGRNRKGLKI